MISSVPEQVASPEEIAEQPAEEVVEHEITNVPEYLVDEPEAPKSEETPESVKQVTETPKAMLKIGDIDVPLDAEVVFDENLKAPLSHVKEQYQNLRSRYGELGQKEEAARQLAAKLERDAQLTKLERKELDEIKEALASGNKKEAIDKFFMKAGINPATWWPQFFEETAHIYEQRSQMNEEEKRIAALQAENEMLKRSKEEVESKVASKDQTENLAHSLQDSVVKAGIKLQTVQGVWQSIQAVQQKVAKGETGDLPVESIQFVKNFQAATPKQQIQMLVDEAKVTEATGIALGIANELDSELAKDDNVVVDLRAQILNPYRNPKMTREDFKDYLKIKWAEKLGKRPTNGDGVQKVDPKTAEAKPDGKPVKGQPLSMWDILR